MAGNDSYTKLLLHCDGADTSTTFTDDSPSVHGNATVGGTAQVDTDYKKFGTGSLMVDGDSDWIYYATHADWNLGGNNFTLDFWVRFNTLVGGTYPTFVDRWTAAPNRGYWFGYDVTAQLLELDYSTDGSNSLSFTKSWTAVINTWYHIAFVRNGADLQFFVNGVQQGTTANIGTTTIYNNSLRFAMDGPNTNGSYLNGWMDEIRLSDIARWTANFDPPTVPYTKYSNVNGVASYSVINGAVPSKVNGV